jgi:hypothetical protein
MMASMPSFFRVGNDLVGNIADDFLTVLHCLVLKRVAAVGGAEDGAAAGQDATDALERELEGLLRPDQPVEAIGNADDLPLVLEDGRLDDSADDRVEPRGITAPSADADATNLSHVTEGISGRPV